MTLNKLKIFERKDSLFGVQKFSTFFWCLLDCRQVERGIENDQ